MEKVRNTLAIFGLLILISIFVGCSTDININDYINKQAPLELHIRQTELTALTDSTNNLRLAVNSEKYNKLVQWGNENTKGWQSTPASYITEIYVSQGDFRLLYTPGIKGVVIGFKDKKGKPRQYSKTTEIGELDFLAK